MSKYVIAPSVLGADKLNMQHDIEAADHAGADMFHIDIMDGVFVPNLSFGPDFISAIRAITRLPLDIHLMVSQPEKYIKTIANNGADLINVHVESTKQIYRVVQSIKEKSVKAGIVLNPGTAVSTVEPLLNVVDNVLVMTVCPGFGEQKFINNMVSKIKQLSDLKQQHSDYNYSIEVDGGINNKTIVDCKNAGANVFVAGSFVFENNIQQQIDSLKRAV